MKKVLLLLGTILTINSYAQISFEKGYFIKNSGQKVDCLIKNIDWKNNPSDFKYKLSENNEIKKIDVKSVKEFGIYNISKYLSKKVEIDKSSEDIQKLSYEKNPIFKSEQLFLKVLVEGKANLYFYEDGSLRRFFYNKGNSNIKQLVFKSYKVTDDNFETKVGSNNHFRQQLWTDLKCATIKISEVERLEYRKNNLINFFSRYNKCSHSDFTDYEKKPKREIFHLTLRPRLSSSSLEIKNAISSFLNTNFGKKLNFGFGIEAEFVLPYNKNQWAVLIEPTYQNFKKKIENAELTSEVKYNIIQVPVGLRHYFFLNKNSKIFVNASYVFNLNLKSSISLDMPYNSSSLDINSRNNLAFGIGYKLNNRYVVEMRYQTNRNILGDYVYWGSSYNTCSIILGYSIF